jgi:hypothetical protein
MSKKIKGRTGWHQATLNTTKLAFHFIFFSNRIKATIVALALLGLRPIGQSELAFRKGGIMYA